MNKENELKLIPIYETYMEYMIQVLIKLPRTERFSIGTEIKTSSIGTDFKQMMYSTLENIMYLSKIPKNQRLNYLNRIDSQLNTQRILLRIMKKYAWIDIKKFNTAIGHIYEIGKILGGLVKYYAKDDTKSI